VLRAAAIAGQLLLCACASERAPVPGVDPTGPGRVDLEVVEDHARQFRDELQDRVAGSQQEQAASVYILGHLQQAGYVVLLDAVPVEDLVRSTNVVAQPPGGGDPATVVVVSYDAPARAGEERAVGLFLELARALRARVSEHAVQFVALGAEHASVGGGRLGSRRLAQQLLDEDADPFIVRIESVSRVGPVVVGGQGTARIAAVLGAGPDADSAEGDPIFERASFDHAVVSGPADELGRSLLDFLTS
jgi:hypothetical protein